MKRIRFDRASIESALEAAKQVFQRDNKPRFIEATAIGYGISLQPPKFKRYVSVDNCGYTFYEFDLETMKHRPTSNVSLNGKIIRRLP